MKKTTLSENAHLSIELIIQFIRLHFNAFEFVSFFSFSFASDASKFLEYENRNCRISWGRAGMSENLLSISNHQFDDVIAIIVKARSRAMKAVNAELINMYLEIGAYVSERVKSVGQGISVVADFSATPYFNYLFYHVLERQIGSMLYERTMLSNEKHKELITRSNGLAALRDAHVFEFLNLEEPDKERGCDR